MTSLEVLTVRATGKREVEGEDVSQKVGKAKPSKKGEGDDKASNSVILVLGGGESGTLTVSKVVPSRLGQSTSSKELTRNRNSILSIE